MGLDDRSDHAADRRLSVRRRLLQSVSALPLLAAWPARSLFGADRDSAEAAAHSAKDVLDVMEFEALARANLPPAHFAYLATGVDDDRTVRWNHEAFSLLEIRAHRFVGVDPVDMSVSLFGTRWPTPVYLSAVAAQRAFGGEGEIDVAHAAATRSTLMMLSSDASTAPEDVIKARGAPIWQQLYPTDDWSVTQAVVRRAQRAGATAIVLTADYMPGRNNETLQRGIRLDKRQCDECHTDHSPNALSEAPIYDGLDVSRVKELVPPGMTWEYLDRLRHIVSVKLLVKGIVTGADADNCVRHGADGVIVSNHGGRNEETLRSTIECLPEVVAAVRRRVPVLLDGGVRRGTDIFKALALGASAIGLGRPQAWGLAAFGQPGVEAVLDIYRRELHSVMQQAGTPNVAAITPDHVVLRGSRAAFAFS